MFNIRNNYQAPQNRLYGLFSRSTYSTEYRLMCVGVKSPVTSFVYSMNTMQDTEVMVLLGLWLSVRLTLLVSVQSFQKWRILIFVKGSLS